ncbi:MAG: hypothetical protein Q7U04_14985 [Bacteriovorax sp.]|nr:hypothetical protein [Bacteriovorax sp.]
MTNNEHKLEDLFSDAGPFNESDVVKAIKPFVFIQKDANDVYFQESKLTVDERILVYGLTKKLLKYKGRIESEVITAIEVQKKTGIKKGSIDPMFKKLKDEGFLVGKIGYEIPMLKVSEIIKIINKKA